VKLHKWHAAAMCIAGVPIGMLVWWLGYYYFFDFLVENKGRLIGAFLSIASASVGRTISFLYPGDDSDYFVGIESYQFVFYFISVVSLMGMYIHFLFRV
jgi:hypothetical protein